MVWLSILAIAQGLATWSLLRASKRKQARILGLAYAAVQCASVARAEWSRCPTAQNANKWTEIQRQVVLVDEILKALENEERNG